MTKEQWRAIRVFNSWDLMKRSATKLCIEYVRQDLGRAGHGAYWAVYGCSFLTDPGGPWYNDGHKVFHIWNRADKQPQLKAAMSWVHQEYDIDKWERGPWDTYFIKGAMAKAKGADVRE